MERSMITAGASPQDVDSYAEFESEEDFLRGRAIFCRTWPGFYAQIGGPRSPLTNYLKRDRRCWRRYHSKMQATLISPR